MRVGAPKGGRVHWLVWALRGHFLKDYQCDYNYLYHNYRFVRYAENRVRYVVDEFLVIRTSKRCWRVMYWNNHKMEFIYFNASTYRECASKILDIYSKHKEL
jgi:hypothetical protein